VVKTDERLREEQTATAQTRVPIHPHLAERWSPRLFDADAVLEADDLVAVLEAARWAATWGHRQPVRFLVGVRGDETNYANAPPEIVERDAKGRDRLPLEEVTYAGTWGQPLL